MYLKETQFDSSLVLKQGDENFDVKRAQEWLSLNQLATSCDGEYGPATALRVKQFRTARRLPDLAGVDKLMFDELCFPMSSVLKPTKQGPNLNVQVVGRAKQHLSKHPREVGRKSNCGPWVRLYCRGKDGPDYAWCCGFVLTILEQACLDMGIEMPYKFTLGCDSLADQAEAKGKLVNGAKTQAVARLRPGSFFLICNPKNPSDRIHTGIVTRFLGEVVETIEGNTNDEGAREGYEVCSRVRRVTSLMDFAAV